MKTFLKMAACAALLLAALYPFMGKKPSMHGQNTTITSSNEITVRVDGVKAEFAK